MQKAIQMADKDAAFCELARRTSGIFIVRLHEVGLVDHAVAVDASNRVIIDSVEATAIDLTARNLARCSGEKAK